MLLTNSQILSLAEAITHLDGQHLMQIVEGKPVQVFKSYLITHAARWILARAQGCLYTAIEDFNRAKDALINHHSNGTGVLSPNMGQAFASFVADLEKLKAEAVELHLDQINLADLKLGENEKLGRELPIAVLSALQPLIKAVDGQNAPVGKL